MTIVRPLVPLAFAAFFAFWPLALVNGFSNSLPNHKQPSSTSRLLMQENYHENVAGVSSRRQVLNFGLASLVLSTINPEIALAEEDTEGVAAAADVKKPPAPASSAPAKKKRFAKTATKRSAPKSEDGSTKESVASKAASFILGQ